jgi:hypothetical protein
MPSADQVPIKLPHLKMLRPKWVVLIAGSTGSALRAVRPPNLHITPGPSRFRLSRKRDGFLVSLAPGHHGPDHPREVAQAIKTKFNDRMTTTSFEIDWG